MEFVWFNWQAFEAELLGENATEAEVGGHEHQADIEDIWNKLGLQREGMF